VQRQHQLSEIVLTLHALGGLTDATRRREQQADQDGNDAEDDKKFRQGESVACGPSHGCSSKRE
jgi:hypothetical protein